MSCEALLYRVAETLLQMGEYIMNYLLRSAG